MHTGGSALISQLVAEGVRHLFTVPGESFVSVLDAMHGLSTIRPITCRNEAGAAMMAEATGKLTGEPGVAMVTRGPGAANAVAGVYIAQQDATPMLLFIATSPRDMAQRASFQSIDVAAVFSQLSKWCAIVPSAAALPDFVSRAMRIARADRPGPVVLALPEDILLEFADVPSRSRIHAPPVGLFSQLAEHVAVALATAQRPIVILGGSIWSADAARNMQAFAERFDVPVVCSFRRQSHFDNGNLCYAGHAGLGMDDRLRAGLKISDCIIAIGTRLGDVTSNGFQLFDGRDASQRLIVVSPEPQTADTPYPHANHFTACPIATANELANLQRMDAAAQSKIWRRDMRQAYVMSTKPTATPGAVQMEEVICHLSTVLPDTAIITSGAGNYASFLHRYFSYKTYCTQLAPTSGSMGYGLPAAIAAKLAHPDRLVVALAGDGCFQMTAPELATAVQFGLPLIIIIANNGALGTIRMHQEMRYPGRVIATSLINPDFVALARASGAAARRVSKTTEFADAINEAIEIAGEHQRPAVIELMLDIDAISPTTTIKKLRAVRV